MFKIFPFVVLAMTIACKNNPDQADQPKEGLFEIDQTKNDLLMLGNSDSNTFQWLNEPEEFELIENLLRIKAVKGTDFFNNPEDGSITATAPFLYQEVTGDFVATALVKPDFASVWNAGVIMVHIDSTHWIKFAFEYSDATGKSIVSVVTNEVSDDANGVILSAYDKIWLRIIRKRDIYALHWSKDGKEYKMARLSSLPSVQTVKVGIEAQCPVGEAAIHEFLYFSVENKTIKDLRKGV